MPRPIKFPRTTAELAARAPEAQVQATAIDLARFYGWQVFHVHDSRRGRDGQQFGDVDAAGFPDMLAIRGDRLVVIEFKRPGRRPTQKQADWLAAFTGLICRCGTVGGFRAEVHVWTALDGDRMEGVFRWR